MHCINLLIENANFFPLIYQQLQTENEEKKMSKLYTLVRTFLNIGDRKVPSIDRNINHFKVTTYKTYELPSGAPFQNFLGRKVKSFL